MNRLTAVAAISAACALVAGLAVAQDPAAAVAARQAHMEQYQNNLMVLGRMAQGAVEYDAAAAQTAADKLVELAATDISGYWIEGTAAGEIARSRALPALWENFEQAGEYGAALNTAAIAMQTAAGVDLPTLQAAMGPLGGACSACHQAFRAPN